ncbi:hypothetical protein [Methylobacterium sp. A54F]
MFRPVAKSLSILDRVAAISMMASLSLAVVEYMRLLALPAHFV